MANENTKTETPETPKVTKLPRRKPKPTRRGVKRTKSKSTKRKGKVSKRGKSRRPSKGRKGGHAQKKNNGIQWGWWAKRVLVGLAIVASYQMGRSVGAQAVSA